MSEANELLALLGIYKWTLMATPLLATALSFVGLHLMARGQSLQILVVSQGSSWGVLLGLALSLSLYGHGHEHLSEATHHFLSPTLDLLDPSLLPFLLGLTLAGLSYLWSESLRWNKNPALVPALLLMGLAVLMGLSHVTASLSPHLEAHMSSIYFGDLATLSDAEAQAAALLSFLGLGALFKWRRDWLRQSFNLAILGYSRPLAWGFTFLALFLISLSIQYLGLLFTLGSLFVPASLLALGSELSHHQYQIRLGTASLVGAFLGFIASLLWPILPTAPAVVLGLTLVSGLLRHAPRKTIDR